MPTLRIEGRQIRLHGSLSPAAAELFQQCQQRLLIAPQPLQLTLGFLPAGPGTPFRSDPLQARLLQALPLRRLL
jgi:hypothetical protein